MRDWKRYVRDRLSGLGLSPERESEIAEEVAQDIEQRFADLTATGLTEHEALEEIERDSSDWQVLARDIGAAKGRTITERLRVSTPPRLPNQRLQLFADSLWQDFRFIVRSLSKSPGFVAVAIASLALGIGANATVFSILNQIGFQPLPYPDAERIVSIIEQSPSGDGWLELMNAKLSAIEEHSQSIEATVQLMTGRSATLSGDGFSERIIQQIVDIETFAMFGTRPQIGRLFEPDDVEPGGRSEAIIISHGLWQRRFGGSDDALGSTLYVEGVKKTVIGVMEPEFWLIRQSDDIALWRASDAHTRPMTRGLGKFARLREGVSIEQAEAEAEAISAQWDEANGDSATRWPTRFVPLRDVVSGSVDSSLWMLQAAVGLVLLIACVNVANMMLARGAMRQRELTVRLALGGARSRIARLLLMESLILGLLGGVAGVLVAVVGIRIFVTLAPAGFPMVQEMRIDSDVLLFLGGVSVATGLLFGLFPAWQSFRLDLTSAMKGGGRDTSRGMGRRARGALLISELALAATLLGCAGLLINGLLDEIRSNWGYRTEGVLTAVVSLDGENYWTREFDRKRVQPAAPLYWSSLLEEMRAIPGVESAGIGYSLPIYPGPGYPFSIVGRAEVEDKQQRPRGGPFEVDPGFFQTLEIPLLQGRYITHRDSADAPWTAVVNRTFAERHFPNENPIGQAIQINRSSSWNGVDLAEPQTREIVGVVENTRKAVWVATPPARIYYSYLQSPTVHMGEQHRESTVKTLYLRSTNPNALVAPLRTVAAELDPTQVLSSVREMDAVIAETVSRNRFLASFLGVFAAIAIALALVGVYGVISFSVNQRSNEFGLRMALGAQRKDVRTLVLKDALQPAALGLAIGLVASFGFRRVLDGLVYGLTAVGPLTFGAIALILAATAIVAALAPAIRAASVEPSQALRHD